MQTQITHWRKSFSPIETTYGVIPYIEWCEYEVERLGSENHYILENRDNFKNKKICIMRRNG